MYTEIIHVIELLTTISKLLREAKSIGDKGNLYDNYLPMLNIRRENLK